MKKIIAVLCMLSLLVVAAGAGAQDKDKAPGKAAAEAKAEPMKGDTKQADAKMLADLNDWFREQRRLKPPPVIGVVSKIDGLRPVMEWSPPYDWESPSRPKEQSIREAVDYARQSAGAGLRNVVPVCSDRERGRVHGIEEWLLPMIIVQLDEARAVSLVRSLHHDYDRQKVGQTLSQLVAAGRRITDAIRKSLQD